MGSVIVGAPLTVNEARAVLKIHRHWPACDRPMPMDGAESAAWINLVSAARQRVCTCGHPLGPHADSCDAETTGR